MIFVASGDIIYYNTSVTPGDPHDSVRCVGPCLFRTECLATEYDLGGFTFGRTTLLRSRYSFHHNDFTAFGVYKRLEDFLEIMVAQIVELPKDSNRSNSSRVYPGPGAQPYNLRCTPQFSSKPPCFW